MTEICTQIEIEAPAGRVWQALTDFAAYTDWNPVMRPVSGEAKVGARLTVHVRFPNGFRVSFRPTVLVADPPRELRWQGHFLFARLFRGEHSFVLEPGGERGVKFIQREVYSGLLRPFILLLIASSNRRAFDAMNQALKARAERHSLPTLP